MEWNYKCPRIHCEAGARVVLFFLAKLLWQAFEPVPTLPLFSRFRYTGYSPFPNRVVSWHFYGVKSWSSGKWGGPPPGSVIRFNRLSFLPGTTIRAKLLAKLGNVDKTRSGAREEGRGRGLDTFVRPLFSNECELWTRDEKVTRQWKDIGVWFAKKSGTYGWLCECAWTKTLVLRCLLDNGINGLELLVA